MFTHTSDLAEPLSAKSYFSLLRRLNLLRQVANFRTERHWDAPHSPMERTRQFFHVRGVVPYHFEPPVELSRSPGNPFTAVSVFFGPPRSEQMVIFARRQNDSRYVLIHLNGGVKTEVESFPLDKRFGVSRQARIASLFGWRVRWGTFDQYINPVEFVVNPTTQAIEIRVRINALVENGLTHEMPAQLVGTPKGTEYHWAITRLGQSHDWFPETNEKLFLPGYEPHEVVYNLDNETFLCKGAKKTGSGSARWAIWNNRWDQEGCRPLISGLEARQIGCMAVNTIENNRTIYSCVLGKLPDSHPLSADTPGIMLAGDNGQMGLVPLHDLVDITHVLAVRVAGSRSGIFHCLRRGPTAQLVMHQNGIPLNNSLDDQEFLGFSVEELGGAPPSIRINLVTSEHNGQRLVLHTAKGTAWMETLAMMSAPLRELADQEAEQERSLRQFIEERQGSSVTVFRLDEHKERMDRALLVKWWSYLAAQVRRHTGESLGPYMTRSLAMKLFEAFRTEKGEYHIEPLLLPLADILGVRAKAVGNLEQDQDFVRFSAEMREFLVRNRLLITLHDVVPTATENGEEVLLILHPAALQWKESLPANGQPESESPPT